MWRKVSKFDVLMKIKASSELKSSLPMSRFKGFFKDLTKIMQFEGQKTINPRCPLMGFSQNMELSSQKDVMGRSKFGFSKNPCGISGFYGQPMCCYASVAEAIVSASSEEDDEIRELVEEINKYECKKAQTLPPKELKLIGGMPQGRYHALRKRQVKMETEAWEEAAKEYQELLADMCEQKLAPNLPYMKSLFLGWFEPLKDAIKAEQELGNRGKNRGSYVPQFGNLPPDMMAVITMHKLMGLLMTGGGSGSATVVQAALQIGEAIEHEVVELSLNVVLS